MYNTVLNIFETHSSANTYNLTIGKEYYILYDYAIGTDDYYILKNDKDAACSYPVNCFMTFDEYRNKKLEDIGI
jgi:hypothetical protein